MTHLIFPLDTFCAGHLHLSVLRLLSILKCKAARDRRLGIEVNLHHAGPGFILPGNIEDLGGAFNELDLSSCNLTGRVLFLSHTFCLSL